MFTVKHDIGPDIAEKSLTPHHEKKENHGSLNVTILEIFAGIVGFDTTIIPQTHCSDVKDNGVS